MKTHRIFRTLRADMGAISARLENVLVIRVVEDEIRHLHPAAWAWGRGFYADTGQLSEEENKRLQTLNDRCLALEMLYRNVSIWRQNFAIDIPLNGTAEELLYQEAKSFLETESTNNLPLLSRYSTSLNLDLHSAAKLALLAQEEKRACVLTTELFKIEWENKLFNSQFPLDELESLKKAYPIF